MAAEEIGLWWGQNMGCGVLKQKALAGVLVWYDSGLLGTIILRTGINYSNNTSLPFVNKRFFANTN